jgi:hypothetical protein
MSVRPRELLAQSPARRRRRSSFAARNAPGSSTPAWRRLPVNLTPLAGHSSLRDQTATEASAERRPLVRPRWLAKSKGRAVPQDILLGLLGSIITLTVPAYFVLQPWAAVRLGADGELQAWRPCSSRFRQLSGASTPLVATQICGRSPSYCLRRSARSICCCFFCCIAR